MLKCPDCDVELIIVGFGYDKETGKLTPNIEAQWFCQYCGHQQPVYVCRVCGKDQNEVKLKTMLDIKCTYKCTDCMEKE